MASIVNEEKDMNDMNDMNDEKDIGDVISNVEEILQYRRNFLRKDQNVCYITSALLKYVNKKTEEIIRELVSAHLSFFLKECDVYVDMTRERAMDALLELTNLAVIFANSHEYFQVCEQIDKIRASYPITIE